MGIPILTSEGFIGRRFIIDDYFRAGDTLRAGDVAGIERDPNQDNHPRLFKITLGVDPQRVVGVVHTPPALSLGGSIAKPGEIVPVVSKGLARVLSAGAIAIGDPLTPSGDSATPTGADGSVARVKKAAAGEVILGRSLSSADGAGQAVDVLVDIAGWEAATVVVADAGPDQSVWRSSRVELDGSGSEGTDLSYSWAQSAGETATLNGPETATPWFTAPSQPADLVFRLTVESGGGVTGADDVDVSVVNRPPVADAGPDQTVEPGDGVTLDGSGSSDPDNDSLLYVWSQESGVTVSPTVSGSSLSFTAPGSAGTLEFKLTVYDDYNASDSDTVVITVGATVHEDHQDHIDVSAVSYEDHQDHDDVPAISHGDFTDNIYTPAVSHQDHQDHDDLSSMPHGDYNDHIDTPAASHGDYADFIDAAGRPHSDHQDHDDVAAVSHGDYADFIDAAGRPHSDHQDHDDVAAVSHGDYADFIDAAGRPHSDHQDHDDAYFFNTHIDHDDHDDLSSMPHGDYNDHIDTPAASHQDHQDHDDLSSMPHGDYNDHIDVAAVSHQDHQDHDDLSSMPHGDYNDHIDTPAASHGDYADFIDAAGRPHSDHQDHDDVAAASHGDYADFIDAAGRPHSDHQDHDDVAAVSHGDYADFIDAAGRPHSDHQDHDDVAAVPHGDHDDHEDHNDSS